MDNTTVNRIPRGSRVAPVILVELCLDRQFTTPGTSTFVAYQTGPVITGIGPQIEDIVIHAIGRNFTANFAYKVTAEYSYNGKAWTAFSTDVLPVQSASGNKIGAAFTTRTNFGLQIRFQIEVTDSGASEVGELSITAAIRLFA